MRPSTVIFSSPDTGRSVMFKDVLALVGLCIIIAKAQQLYTKVTA